MNPDGLEWVLYPPHLNGMKRFEDTDIARLIAKVPLAVPSGEVEGLRVEGPGNSIVSGPVSRAEYLKQHLNKSLSVYGLAKGRGDVTLVHDKPAELRDKFQDIADACAELENRFNVSPNVDLTSCNAWEPIPYDIFTGLNVVSVRRGEYSQYAVRDALLTLRKLKLWSQQAANDARSRVSRTMKRHKGNTAERTLIGNLCGAWFQAYESLPEYNQAHPFSTFIRFVLAHERIDLRNDQIRHLVKHL